MPSWSVFGGLLVAALFLCAPGASAQDRQTQDRQTQDRQTLDRQTLGFGRLLTNDFFGDGRDRWRSHSYSYSIVRGPTWTGRAPSGFGEVLEFRFRNEILSPSSLGNIGNEDRPYVGLLSLGVHTHLSRGPYDIRLGADAVAVGPQTGVGTNQEWLHEQISAPAPAVIETQLPDALYLDLSAEVSRQDRVSDRVSIRYFADAQVGTEDLVRVGLDLIVGSIVHDDLLIRDVVSGHLYRGTQAPGGGIAFVLGADAAHVWDSAWLPADRGVEAMDTRYRLRGGMHWQLANDISFFYGLTYLSEEFVDQDEGQLTGSLKLNFNF